MHFPDHIIVCATRIIDSLALEFPSTFSPFLTNLKLFNTKSDLHLMIYKLRYLHGSIGTLTFLLLLLIQRKTKVKINVAQTKASATPSISRTSLGLFLLPPVKWH
jgi:hypothetical protein